MKKEYEMGWDEFGKIGAPFYGTSAAKKEARKHVKRENKCNHHGVFWETCPNCGYEKGWCNKCDAEVGRQPNKSMADILTH